MISVVIPTLNCAEALGRTLAALTPAAVDGLIKEALVIDAGSDDQTLAVADEAGARVLSAAPAEAFAAGFATAAGDWGLVIAPGTVVLPGWEAAAQAHMTGRPDCGGWLAPRAAQSGAAARWRERAWALKAAVLGPDGRAGLLIPMRLVKDPAALSGAAGLAAVARRIGRGRLAPLSAAAFVPA